tara:strand:- start:65 stop:256 length:192 start_codon:yes stop_codon:yes gene_type:complete
MDKNDRKVMTDDLLSLGLHRELLDGLGDSMIKRLFHLIGWAAPVYTERSINAKKKSKIIKKKN